jgi:hypothetical protein
MGLHVDPEYGTLPGVMLLRPEVQGAYRLVSISQFGTEVRFYPQIDAQGNPLPIRTGLTEDDVGDKSALSWICSEHHAIVMKGGTDGKEKITFLTTIEGDVGEHYSRQRGLAVWDRLRQTVYSGLENGTHPEWYSLVKGDSMDVALGSKGASKPHVITFFFGACTYQGTQKGAMSDCSRQAPCWSCVFYAKSAAKRGLGSLIMEMAPDHEQYGDDFDRVFVNNHILDLNKGPLVMFKKPGLVVGGQAQQQVAPVTFGQSMGGSISGRSSGSEIVRRLEATVDSQPVVMPLDFVRSVVRPWDQVLQIWKDERELVAALEQGFPDRVLIEAFRDTPHYLSARLVEMMHRIDREAAAGVMPIGAGGMPGQPGAPIQMGGYPQNQPQQQYQPEPIHPIAAPPQMAPAPQAPQQAAPPFQPDQVPQQAPPQTAPAPQAPPQMAPAPQAPPQMAPAPQAPPQMAPAPQAPPQTAPAPQAPPQMAPAPQAPPQMAPQMAPAPQAPPQMAPAPQAPPQTAPAPQAPPQAGPEIVVAPTQAPVGGPADVNDMVKAMEDAANRANNPGNG